MEMIGINVARFVRKEIILLCKATDVEVKFGLEHCQVFFNKLFLLINKSSIHRCGLFSHKNPTVLSMNNVVCHLF